MSSEIILEIRLRIAERHAVVLENCMHLEPRFETKQAPHLALGQGAGAITLHASASSACLARSGHRPCRASEMSSGRSRVTCIATPRISTNLNACERHG